MLKVLPVVRRSGALALLCGLFSATIVVAQKPAAKQPDDPEYTAKIKEYLTDPRFSTELVDHLPASSTIPTPLKFLGSMPGQPGELYYAEDIYRYYQELAKDSPRAKFWKFPLKTEEGRDMVVLAIGSEESMKNLDKYKADLAALGDPRKTTEEQAQKIIHTSKPIYWITSGIHSPETGGPQMLVELAYRLLVEESPTIKNIRDNAIIFITPVVEPDGRDKQVDTYYYGKKTGKTKPPLMYWGKYVAHDNNRDGMGQLLHLTQNITAGMLEWHPTILHDLHEAQSYLYVSTGTGPYNPSLDPIAIDEWWMLAETEVMEMAKRGVPGVFTYGYYDGWVPNYLFWIAESHNSFGRFYEVQSYGPDNQPNLQLPATATSREWYRPNPPLASIKWGPRANTDIQESAILIALNKVATEKQLYLENYWMKSKRSVEKGKDGPTFGWVIPAAQKHRVNTVEMVNDLRHQGVEIEVAPADATYGDVKVAAGDYIIRADQPYRTLVDLYFSLQNYPITNPIPYDDTGWTMPLMRNVTVRAIADKAVLAGPTKPIMADVVAPGVIAGTGDTLVVENNTDNVLATFRFKNPTVKMEAAEQDFTVDGHKLRAGAFVIHDASNAEVKRSIDSLGLTAYLTSGLTVKTHPLTVPRIGYVHSWARTQDEGWVRAALDHYGIPYTYFADQKLREGHLREKYDVILLPSIGGTSVSQVNGIPKLPGGDAVPYKKSDITPNLGAEDSTDDIRGGMGIEGVAELVKFVDEGGTLITEGSTSTILPDYGITSLVTVEHPTNLYAKGALMRGMISDAQSPVMYGYNGTQLPVYFSQEPVLAAASGGGRGFGGGGFGGARTVPGVGVDITPNASPIALSPYNPDANDEPEAKGLPTLEADGAAARAAVRRGAGGRAGAGGGAGGGRGAEGPAEPSPRVVLSFPTNPNDILLSGELAGGTALSGRAMIVDQPLGEGHVVMFAIRPFWRWQTQGTFALGFNTIINWDHLDAGKAVATGGRGGAATAGDSQQQ
ncbi:Zinc carboxypeptidase [Bryocella elongata]|uniref:Zinc carboxypeptidase n=1 Tax=Bryocella elongata TaxID=863522 RepID=A0A1H5SF96_9BACT|nr:M14 family zinc carboxypeptidase [Bryocella elongata]SEF49100.1 Zinc carboxypeptidase [Bryocella elongata]